MEADANEIDIAISTHLYTQESIPVGTVLLVRLETSLSNKSRPGRVLRATVMQDVPLANGTKIRAGATVTGQVVTAWTHKSNIARLQMGRATLCGVTLDWECSRTVCAVKHPLRQGRRRMITTLLLYCVCACAFIIWCSLQTNLAYVVISNAVLNKWKIERENLIVIELFSKGTEPGHGCVSDSLEVSEHELAGLLGWIPRRSTVVFCRRLHIDHFDGRVEAALLRAAIDAVYLLDVREYSRLKGICGRNVHPPPLAHGRRDNN